MRSERNQTQIDNPNNPEIAHEFEFNECPHDPWDIYGFCLGCPAFRLMGGCNLSLLQHQVKRYLEKAKKVQGV